MNTYNFSNGGQAPEISNIIIVALYHPDTGKIMHMHTVTMFKGGRVVSEKEAIDTAIEHATKAGHSVDRLKVITSKDPAHMRSPYRIDVKTGEFVAVTVQDRRAR